MPRLTTIAIAALDEFEFHADQEGSAVRPDSLAEHVDWEELGLLERALDTEPLPLCLHESGSPSTAEARMLWISPFGRLVVFRWTWEVDSRVLEALDWSQHWQESWSVLEPAWPRIAKSHGLPPQEWLFAFSVAEGTESEISPLFAIVRHLSDGSSHLSQAGVAASIGWDGGLVARVEGRCRTELDAVVAIAAVASLRWQNDNHALREIRTMLRDVGDGDRLDLQTSSITRLARRVYDGQTTLDSDTLCVYGSDELIARAFSQGWNMERLTARANDAIHRLTHANELDTRIQLRESSQAQERWLLLLALVGLCGTLAGVLATVDFRNSIISSEVLRVGVIVTGTILIGGTILLRSRVRQRTHADSVRDLRPRSTSPPGGAR